MTVVVGYVPTAEGSTAVDLAIEESRRRSARLVVVNTSHHGDFSHPSFATEQDIDVLDAQLAAAGLDHEIQRPMDGASAADTILSVAEQVGAELIVIGVRRRSPVGKLLTGSTAQQVLLDANCPVLAVKATRA
ncbi:MAG: universal stress protein [Actinomycetota bacterium]|nr:universal stress protein [Actinomycetota bacterium]